MTYEVTYRGDDGSPAVEVIDAVSRNALFETLKERGVSAIRVEIVSDRPSSKTAMFMRPSIGLVVIGIFTAIVITIFWILDRQGDNPETLVLKVTGGAERVVGPQHTTKMNAPSAKVEDGGLNITKGQKDFPIHTDEFGVRRYPNGVRVYDDKTPMLKPATPFGDKPIFENKALNELASFMDLQPGATLFGTRKYDQAYLAKLKQGLSEKIEILDTDDEKTRAVKQEMKDVQQAMRHMSDNEILAMVKDTYSELMRLARYKTDVQTMVKEAIKNTEDLTEQDYEDIITAANQMLAKEGIAPIRNTVLIRKNIKMNHLKKGPR